MRDMSGERLSVSGKVTQKSAAGSDVIAICQNQRSILELLGVW